MALILRSVHHVTTYLHTLSVWGDGNLWTNLPANALALGDDPIGASRALQRAWGANPVYLADQLKLTGIRVTLVDQAAEMLWYSAGRSGRRLRGAGLDVGGVPEESPAQASQRDHVCGLLTHRLAWAESKIKHGLAKGSV